MGRTDSLSVQGGERGEGEWSSLAISCHLKSISMNVNTSFWLMEGFCVRVFVGFVFTVMENRKPRSYNSGDLPVSW